MTTQRQAGWSSNDLPSNSCFCLIISSIRLETERFSLIALIFIHCKTSSSMVVVNFTLAMTTTFLLFVPLLYQKYVLTASTNFVIIRIEVNTYSGSEEDISMGRFQDLTGMRFGRLTVIKRAENGVCCGKPVVRWLCECDCGNMITTEGHSLKRGRTRSCGCLNREVQKRDAKTRAFKHGGTNTRLYNIYSLMKRRCLNKNNPKYKDYGGRGIKICDEWLEDFSNFQSWSLSNGYDDSLSIDRIDVDGDYCPENCRWVDNYTQANNKTTTVRITVDGETHSVSEWMRITGARRDTIMRRMRNGYRGMDIFYRRPKKNT